MSGTLAVNIIETPQSDSAGLHVQITPLLSLSSLCLHDIGILGGSSLTPSALAQEGNKYNPNQRLCLNGGRPAVERGGEVEGRRGGRGEEGR